MNHFKIIDLNLNSVIYWMYHNIVSFLFGHKACGNLAPNRDQTPCIEGKLPIWTMFWKTHNTSSRSSCHLPSTGHCAKPLTLLNSILLAPFLAVKTEFRKSKFTYPGSNYQFAMPGIIHNQDLATKPALSSASCCKLVFICHFPMCQVPVHLVLCHLIFMTSRARHAISTCQCQTAGNWQNQDLNTGCLTSVPFSLYPQPAFQQIPSPRFRKSLVFYTLHLMAIQVT